MNTPDNSDSPLVSTHEAIYLQPLHNRDEKDPIDGLVQIVTRRWHWIVTSTLLPLLAAIFFVAIKSPVYEYSVLIDIGVLPIGSENILQPIEQVTTVMARLESSEIPSAIRTILDVTAEDINNGARIPKIGVDSPEESTIVRITTKGPKSKSQSYREILRRASNGIVQDHSSVVATVREKALGKIEQLHTREKGLEQHLEVYQRILERLSEIDTSDITVSLQLSRIDELVGNTLASILELTSKRTTLQREYEILNQGLAVFQSEISQSVLENQRNLIPALSAAASGLRPTHLVSLPNQSIEPVGVSNPLIIALAIVLGMSGGLFLALVIEAIIKNRDSEPAPSNFLK